ncbi:ABC transporter substrate-binding protein [Chloroflexota bacterium]
MGRKILWLVVSGLMVLSLVMAACGPAEVEEKEVTEKEVVEKEEEKEEEEVEEEKVVSSNEPQYGGRFNLVASAAGTNFDPVRAITGTLYNLVYQHLWEGDWTKGPAGGYGTNETDWGTANNDLFELKAGMVAESWDWTIDEENDQGILVWQIRQGVNWALDSNSEASRLVGGRELTADDVVYTLQRATTYEDAFVYRMNSELRNMDVTKTGPWEVTVKVPLNALITAISRTGDALMIHPPEPVEEYGHMEDWQNSVGTGPYTLAEYVPDSMQLLVRNDNYWMKDPIGPGKGNQLPYIDDVRIIIIPDLSTRQAALRTGKVDWMSGFSIEDAAQMRSGTPELVEKEFTSHQGRSTPTYMRIDKEPFNDIRVRKAMTLATDFQDILQNVAMGKGQLIANPWADTIEYHNLYVGLDDPDFPESVRELYTYNPDKARELLAEAGYPDGFKTTVLVSSTGTTYIGLAEVDYFSILKDMWSKVGIDLTLDIRESGVVSTLKRKLEHEAITSAQPGPVAIFYVGNPFSPGNSHNLSMIDDPVINEAMLEVRLTCLTDQDEAMSIFREKIYKRYLEQVYCIPGIVAYRYSFWWPWLKNYSGENTVGYDDSNWAQWIWIDQEMKKKMGY